MKFGFYQGGYAGLVDKNLSLISKTAHDASQQGAQFLVFPELFLTGYYIHDKLST